MVFRTSAVVFVSALVVGGTSSAPDIARFSGGTLGAIPVGWRMQAFRHKMPTRYSLAHDSDRVVLAADSRDSASALVADADVDLARTPLIEWSWKVDHVIPKGEWGRKGADDFPARVFVIFADGGKTPTAPLFELLSRAGQVRALNYVWANDAVAGRMRPSPYTGQVMMVAVEAGSAKAGTWVPERRNVVDDFQRAFHLPPPPVRAVAVMTDTDDTHAQATALYSDILFVM